jgi:hypothetical protein
MFKRVAFTMYPVTEMARARAVSGENAIIPHKLKRGG